MFMLPNRRRWTFCLNYREGARKAIFALATRSATISYSLGARHAWDGRSSINSGRRTWPCWTMQHPSFGRNAQARGPYGVEVQPMATRWLRPTGACPITDLFSPTVILRCEAGSELFFFFFFFILMNSSPICPPTCLG